MKHETYVYLTSVIGSSVLTGFVVGELMTQIPAPKTPNLFYASIAIASSSMAVFSYSNRTGEEQ